MAHGTRISGTQKSVTAGFTRISGVNKKITKGLTLVGGVQREVSFATGELLGNLAVGTSVYTPINGVIKEFIVVQQGKPSSLYDDSCDGTWLLMKDIYGTNRWYAWSGNSYKISHPHTESAPEILNLFDANIKEQIKTVKIPYVNGNGNFGSVASGSSGLDTQIFLLSGYEVGWTQSTNQKFPIDGACLSYFSGTAKTDSKRIAYLNGTASKWWLRSPNTGGSSRVWRVGADGGCDSEGTTLYYGIRPALILPQSATVDDNFQIIG